MILTPLIQAVLLAFAFLIGSVLGSFLTCTADRMVSKDVEAKEKRSHCPNCGHVLSARDIIPVFSYLFLKGRCRYCKERIPVHTFLGEVALAIAYVLVCVRYGISWDTLRFLLLASMLQPVAFVDYYTLEVPCRFWGIAICGWAASIPLYENIKGQLLSSAFGGLAIPLAIFFMAAGLSTLWKKDALGFADICLFVTAGLYLGWKRQILNIILSCILGILFAVLGRKKKGEAFAFGPAICLSTVLVALNGDVIVDAYLHIAGLV